MSHEDDPVARRLAELPEPDLTDPDNPEWTEEDFARAKPLSEAPPEVQAAFAKTAAGRRLRGAQKAPTKRSVTLRLDGEVLDHYRAGGPGWQTRINAALRRDTGISRGGGEE